MLLRGARSKSRCATGCGTGGRRAAHNSGVQCFAISPIFLHMTAANKMLDGRTNKTNRSASRALLTMVDCGALQGRHQISARVAAVMIVVRRAVADLYARRVIVFGARGTRGACAGRRESAKPQINPKSHGALRSGPGPQRTSLCTQRAEVDGG